MNVLNFAYGFSLKFSHSNVYFLKLQNYTVLKLYRFKIIQLKFS